MSKRKQYDPNKIQRLHRGASNLASVLIRHVVDPLPADKLLAVTMAVHSALEEHRPGRWCSYAFRVLCHYGRTAEWLGAACHFPGLHADAVRARACCRRIVSADDGVPVITEADYHALREVALHLLDLLERGNIGVGMLAKAEDASRQVYHTEVIKQYARIAPPTRRLLLDVLAGARLRDVAPQLGVSEAEVSEAAREVALMAHGLINDSLIPMPANMALMRKHADRYLGKLAEMEAELSPQRAAA